MNTVLQSNKECYLCHSTIGLHDHHIFFGSQRKWSEKYGLKVWLCAKHHNMSNDGVHFNREYDIALKQYAQTYYEAHIGTREQFISEFVRSYI